FGFFLRRLYRCCDGLRRLGVFGFLRRFGLLFFLLLGEGCFRLAGLGSFFRCRGCLFFFGRDFLCLLWLRRFGFGFGFGLFAGNSDDGFGGRFAFCFGCLVAGGRFFDFAFRGFEQQFLESRHLAW